MTTSGGGTPGSAGGPQRPYIRFDVINEAWRLFQQQMSTWVLTTLVAAIINGVVAGALSRVSAFGWLASALPGYFFAAGFYRMAFKQMRGEAIAVSDVFSATDVLGQVIVVALLVTLATTIGFLCLILPGFILTGLWLFAMPLVAEAKMEGVEAMRRSWNALKDEMFSAGLFAFVVIVMAMAGLLALGVGVLFTIPTAILAVAVLYRTYFPDPSRSAP